MNLSILRRTAAEMVAAAVCELYPNVELWGGGETATGFFYDFSVPSLIHLHLIEERMRQIIRERREIRTLEMVPFSARELLKSQGHEVRAEGLGDELVEIVQIGSFCDLSPGPHLKNTAELAAFKIAMKPLPNKGVQIFGWCHSSKGELKQFLKKMDRYKTPQQLGEQMGLWKGAVWLPQGLKMRQELIQFLKKEWFVDALEISGPLGADRIALHRSLGRSKVAEIWTSQESQLQVSFFGVSEEEVISCLQSIGKTLTILGFDHSAMPNGVETDYLVEDALGRNCPIVQVKRISGKGSPTVDFYFTAMIERILSLLLEKNLVMVKLENQ